jgi:hypothetical protein
MRAITSVAENGVLEDVAVRTVEGCYVVFSTSIIPY